MRTTTFASRSSLVAMAVLGMLVTRAPAQETDLAPSALSAQERSEVRKRIAVLRQSVDTLRYTAVAEVYRRFQSVLEGGHDDLLGLYLECLYEVDYKRKGRTKKEFRKWLDDNEDQIESPEHMLALRLQLSYLVLTMEASDVKTTEQLQALLDGVLEHVETVSESSDRLGTSLNVLNRGVMNFAFADAYGLSRFVSVEDKYKWVLEPGQIIKIYERTLHPIARRSHDPAYIARIWDARIQAETALARRATASTPHEQTRFDSFTLPTLRWRRARDLFDAGSQRPALKEMMAVLEGSSSHPQAADWIREVEDLLERGEPQG